MVTSFTEYGAIHEPLLEHVGHLPVIAAYLHPLIQHRNVDLGSALIMLAVHDIDETVTGDIPSFVKKSDHEVREREVARTLLSRDMLACFEAYETNKTIDAKFAKSADSALAYTSPLIPYGGGSCAISAFKRWPCQLVATEMNVYGVG